MIPELIDLAPGYNRKQQARFISEYGGLIFIDEMGKKAKDGALIGHDISREGFQRSVLKLIERKSKNKKCSQKLKNNKIPIPKKYLDMHTELGTWKNSTWKPLIEPTMTDEETRLSY